MSYYAKHKTLLLFYSPIFFLSTYFSHSFDRHLAKTYSSIHSHLISFYRFLLKYFFSVHHNVSDCTTLWKMQSFPIACSVIVVGLVISQPFTCILLPHHNFRYLIHVLCNWRMTLRWFKCRIQNNMNKRDILVIQTMYDTFYCSEKKKQWCHPAHRIHSHHQHTTPCEPPR